MNQEKDQLTKADSSFPKNHALLVNPASQHSSAKSNALSPHRSIRQGLGPTPLNHSKNRLLISNRRNSKNSTQAV